MIPWIPVEINFVQQFNLRYAQLWRAIAAKAILLLQFYCFVFLTGVLHPFRSIRMIFANDDRAKTRSRFRRMSLTGSCHYVLTKSIRFDLLTNWIVSCPCECLSLLYGLVKIVIAKCRVSKESLFRLTSRKGKQKLNAKTTYWSNLPCLVRNSFKREYWISHFLSLAFEKKHGTTEKGRRLESTLALSHVLLLKG